MKLECLHVDTCLPCYWGGHHLPHVKVPIYNGMPFKDIREAVFDELRIGAVMGNTENARLLSADSVDNWKRADQLTRAAYAAVKRDVRGSKKGAKVFRDKNIPDYKEHCESDETVYAFFVFREV